MSLCRIRLLIYDSITNSFGPPVLGFGEASEHLGADMEGTLDHGLIASLVRHWRAVRDLSLSGSEQAGDESGDEDPPLQESKIAARRAHAPRSSSRVYASPDLADDYGASDADGPNRCDDGLYANCGTL